LGVLTILLIFVQGNALWKALHEMLKGFFGIPVIAIPAALFFSAYQVEKQEEIDKLAKEVRWFAVCMMFTSCFIEIMFDGGKMLHYNFGQCLKLFYQDGIAWHGGGMLSAPAFLIVRIFDVTGSKIMICLLLFVSIMLLTKRSLTDLFDLVGKPFRDFVNIVQEDREEGRILKNYENQQIEQERLDEQEALAIAAEGAARKRSMQEEFLTIDIPMTGLANGNSPAQKNSQNPQGMREFFDIPIEENPDKNPEYTQDLSGNSRKVKAKPKPKSGHIPESGDKQLSLMPSLEELIEQATENSKKSKKETERLESMLAIAEEISRQTESNPVQEVYHMPKIEFLNCGVSHGDDATLQQELLEKANKLHDVLGSFNVEVKITNIARGPSVTRYEVQPAAGVKVSKITNLADDIALNFAASGVRIEAPIPGKPAVGIEVPNSQKDMVSLRELLESPEFQKSRSKLTFGVGKDIAGNVIIGDIARMPHMIIAGATGSGKSVCTNSIIMSILYHATPDEVKLILIDPKIVEFRVYDGIPHLLIPVVTDPKKAAGALNWAVQEMLKRYDIFAQNSVRNLEDYNRICEEKPELELQKMPQIVICIDELADLMMTASKEVEEAICRLAQLARAAGMHLIIATQRPTTDIITGLIKANIPSRIALSVMSQIDSRIILDVGGAEKLLGHGDMLYLPSGQPKPVRVQGCFVSTQEIENVVNFIKSQSETDYDMQIVNEVDRMAVTGDKKNSHAEEITVNGDEDLIEQAIEVVVAAGQASTSNLQRRLRLGYARAARIMDELEEMGIIGPYEGAKPRRVLMSPMQLEERRMNQLKNN
ncbi:MAG: DNA translocase FtsK, partial [Oscillospiraceae bacterium]|nr:DNA translocase FtsK [Oscillospiraceae bacterium]